MSQKGARARRRAEQARAAERAAAERARLAARRGRRQARVRRLTGRLAGWLPGRGARPTGLLAQRRRRRVRGLLAVVVLLNALVWLLVPDWSARLGALVVSALVAPVAYAVLFPR